MSKCYGFTFIECITVLLIFTISSYFVVPFFKNIMISSETYKVQHSIIMYLQQAKNDARFYHQDITLCASQDLQFCGLNWNTGLIGFVDQNQNHQREPSEKLLYTEAWNYQYGHLDWRGSLFKNSITFQSDTGLPRGSNGSFFYCIVKSDQQVRIILSSMGHIRVEKTNSC